MLKDEQPKPFLRKSSPLPLPLFSVTFRTLLRKEIQRFLSVYIQTVFTPLISALLYILIFGLSLGKRLEIVPKITYLQFIAPGLIMMGIMNNAFQNTSSSIFISKYLGNIVDILVAPLRYIEVVIAYMLGGIARGLIVGSSIALLARLFTPLPLPHPIFAILFAILSAGTFALLGMLAAIWADRFDDLAIFNTFLLLPLTYLGGIFYTIKILPPFLQTISYANPLLYMINGLRYGFLGISDTSPLFSLLFVTFLFSLLFTLILWIVKSGYKLRT